MEKAGRKISVLKGENGLERANKQGMCSKEDMDLRKQAERNFLNTSCFLSFELDFQHKLH